LTTAEELRERRPSAVTWTPRETRLLQFPSGKVVDMYVRGAICWPTPPQRGGDVGGYAVLGCQNQATGIIHVMEETAFITIENHLDDEGRIHTRGLAGWLNMAHALYGLDRLFWHQDWERFEHYSKKVRECGMLLPKPRLVELLWQDDSLAETLFWTAYATELIQIYEDAHSYDALQIWKGHPGEDVARDPAVWALCVLAMGFAQRPWRKRV
jgi:hypothetical protein